MGEMLPLAFNTLKVASLRNGIRSIFLKDQWGGRLPFAVLLVEVCILSFYEIVDRQIHLGQDLEVRINSIDIFWLKILNLQVL